MAMGLIRSTATTTITLEQIETMHRAALNLAARVGFEVRDEGLRLRIAALPGFRMAGSRVYPAWDRMEAYLAARRSQHNESLADHDKPLLLLTADRALYIVADDGVAMISTENCSGNRPRRTGAVGDTL